MTQEQINKLQELKKLFDAGILTQEEMLEEKAKIIDSPSDNAPISEDKSETQSTKELSKKSLKPILITLGVLVAIIIVVLLFKESSNNSGYYDQDEMTTIDTITVGDEEYYGEDTYSIEEEVQNDDEFAYDPFSGNFHINGAVYRFCDTYAELSINKGFDGIYAGTMVIMMGNREIDPETLQPTGRFFPDHGEATAKVRAKASNNSIVVILDSYTITGTGKDSPIKEYMPANGTQIFRIDYSNDEYLVVPIGDMQNMFMDAEIQRQ